jgi:hypothetical protein
MKHTRTLEVYYVNLSEGNCFPVNRVSTSTIFWEIQTTRMSWPVSQLGKPSNPRVTRRPFRYFWSKPAIITGHGGRRNRTLHNGSDDYDETWGVGKPRVGRVETERAGTGGTNRVKEKKKNGKRKGGDLVPDAAWLSELPKPSPPTLPGQDEPFLLLFPSCFINNLARLHWPFSISSKVYFDLKHGSGD